MRHISAAKFNEQWLTILDDLDPKGVVITKHGKPVARLIPYYSNCADLIGSMAGKVKAAGDLLSTGTTWRAESRSLGTRKTRST
jgi:antitoxin (DNA-binding transcriptional repressor) of toxin-antitoxin stability system